MQAAVESGFRTLQRAPVIPHCCHTRRRRFIDEGLIGWTLMQSISVWIGCCCFVVTIWHEAFNHVQ